ncbi:hypothetical protein AOC36_08745 [Erysipelothrix larvae]|uniref:Polysaccharide chain length determinant N-terminal domain-containing protein n=1 Tax=Erysipelothrix larvae TaxID=1514105 RepID=A0A0X8H106_9FIRM|nr:Wzz/FepE/Etk N-terminal domain-containing protein [Erysipelothrix larvae]AMC94072.1 hypothetical protein AOC36_08745 [Erysipelothrix larvae]
MNQNNNVEFIQEDEISIRELYEIFKPYLLMIVAVGIVFSMVGYLGTKFLIAPMYQSTATLIVNNRRDTSDDSITNDEITSAKNLATVYSIIIKSDAVMGPVVENTNTGITTSQLAKNVSVSAVDSTQVIRVSVKDEDPLLAQKFVNEIVKVAPDIIIDMVEAGSVRVVSLPQVPTSPVSPNTLMNAMIAGILGIMLSAGIVLVRHLMDRTFRSPDDIERYLGVPVIGIIPNIQEVSRGGK